MEKKIIKAMIAFCLAMLSFLIGISNDEADFDKIASAEQIGAVLQQGQTFSIYECSKDEFVARCFIKGVRADKIDYVWDIIRGQYTVDELSRKYFLEPETIRHDRWKFKKKLKN